jgi:hypothetical protein
MLQRPRLDPEGALVLIDVELARDRSRLELKRSIIVAGIAESLVEALVFRGIINPDRMRTRVQIQALEYARKPERMVTVEMRDEDACDARAATPASSI